MAAPDTINNNLFVNGNISAQTMSIPAASVGDTQMQTPSPPSAAVSATKLQHQWQDGFAQGSSTTATSIQQVIHVVRGTTGTLIDLRAGCVVANIGAATIVVDLYKNGSSILSGTITLNNTQTARQVVTVSGFTSSTLAAGDVLEIKTTATAGGGTLGQGFFAMLCVREDPS